jgi:hypothetical protein
MERTGKYMQPKVIWWRRAADCARAVLARLAKASSANAAVPPPRMLDCMELEDRVLFSAAPLALVIVPQGGDPGSGQVHPLGPQASAANSTSPQVHPLGQQDTTAPRQSPSPHMAGPSALTSQSGSRVVLVDLQQVEPTPIAPSGAGQIQLHNQAAGTARGDALGDGSYQSGAPSVTVSSFENSAHNWAIAAVPLADAPQGPPNLPSATYYVAPAGNDTNPGTSIQEPLRTLKAAYDLMPNNVGGTIFLMGGQYDEAMVGWSWAKSGTIDSPIIVQSYPGQRAVVTNEVLNVTWTNAAPGIWYCTPGQDCLVIPLADRPSVQANSQADFTSLPSPLSDSSGNLLYNLSWYNSSTGTLWFRSPTITDPTSQVAMAPTNSQFSIDVGSNYQFKDIDFRYCGYFHQQSGDSGIHVNTVIDGCTFKYMSSGIVGGAMNGTYTNNWIDDIGPALMWVNTSYATPNLAQGLYLNGSNCTVSGNIISRVDCGSAMQFYPYGLNYSMISDNVILDCPIGSASLMGSGWTFANNILIDANYTGPYVSAQNFQITNNYFEGAYLLALESSGTSGDFTGGFQITGNTFNTQAMAGSPVSLKVSGTWDTNSLIDRNTYMGNQFRALYQSSTLLNSVFATLSDWRSGIQAVPGCSAWEVNSTFLNQQKAFDPNMLNQMLDNGTSTQIKQIISQYVLGLPQAINHSYEFQAGAPLSIPANRGLLLGDSDPDGDSLTASLFSAAAHGQVTVDADGSFTYTPAAGFFGADRFTYQVDDGHGNTATGTVTVSPMNQAPTVATPAAATPSSITGTSTALSVLGADDGGETNLSYTWVATGTPPAPVRFSLNGTNASKNTTATFAQAGNYSLQVTITDAGGRSTISSVNLTVVQTDNHILVTPIPSAFNSIAIQHFIAAFCDPLGNALACQRAFTSAPTSKIGTVDVFGLCTATSEWVSGSAAVPVAPADQARIFAVRGSQDAQRVAAAMIPLNASGKKCALQVSSVESPLAGAADSKARPCESARLCKLPDAKSLVPGRLEPSDAARGRLPWNDLDVLVHKLMSQVTTWDLVLGTAVTVCAGSTAGYVIWMLRGGSKKPRLRLPTSGGSPPGNQSRMERMPR